ncbi:MAG: AAA family ATPase [Pseudomonadota bacterium]
MSDGKTFRRWLDRASLSEYEELLVSERVDLQTLRSITNDDLRDLGVPLGDRKRFLAAIDQLNQQSPSEEAPGEAEKATADQHLASHSERRQLTVMAIDLIAYTKLTASLDPEEVREVLRLYRSSCRAIIESYNGSIARYTGDGIQVFFGYPVADESAVRQAIEAGLELSSSIERLNPLGHQLLSRIGIATGLAVVGEVVRHGLTNEQPAFGDPPILAARLQELAQPNAVLVTDSTRQLAIRNFRYLDHGQKALKEHDEPIRVWQVKEAIEHESAFIASHPPDELSPLVGREEELNILLRRWNDVLSGQPQVVALSGEPGIGKSRTTEEMIRRLVPSPGRTIRLNGSATRSNNVLYPVVEFCARESGIRRSDSPAERANKLSTSLPELADRVIQKMPLLAALLGLSDDLESAPSSDLQREETLDGLVDYLLNVQSSQPSLVMVEDLHWVDPTTIELLHRCVARLEGTLCHTMLLVSYRVEFSSPWSTYHNATTLLIRRFSHPEAARLVETLGGSRMSPTLVDKIVERCDGVPLFLEELCKSVNTLEYSRLKGMQHF